VTQSKGFSDKQLFHLVQLREPVEKSGCCNLTAWYDEGVEKEIPSIDGAQTSDKAVEALVPSTH
jgi:hypothetical protein